MTCYSPNESGGFKVPWGMDPVGCIVVVAMAIKGVTYRCPQCLEALTLRAGQIKAKHFAHRGGTVCSYESALHAAAKWQIYWIIDSWLKGYGKAPIISFPCANEKTWLGCMGLINRPLISGKVDEVALEKAVGVIRPDVLLLLNGQPRLGIEILVTNAVNIEKEEKYPIKWIELEATKVIDNALSWAPVNHNIPGMKYCEFCSAIDFNPLKDKYNRIQDEFADWVARARNPEAAQHSAWADEKLSKILQNFKRVHEIKWAKTHLVPPPNWGGMLQPSLDDPCN